MPDTFIRGAAGRSEVLMTEDELSPPPAPGLPPAPPEPPPDPDQPPAIAPRRAARTWWLLGAGAVVAAGIAVAAVVLGGGSSPTPTTYRIATPHVAGGLVLDASGASAFTAAELQGSSIQQLVGGKAQQAVSASYTDPATGTQVLFDGATGPLGDPARLMATLNAGPALITQLPGGSIVWTAVDPGAHGGRAACGAASSSLAPTIRIPICVWQTTTTVGELVQLPATGAALLPDPGIISGDALGGVMRRMRADLEVAG
jgi:hypothetical protein